MGCEVRRVPANWEHPKEHCDELIPKQNGSYLEDIQDWVVDFVKWRAGLVRDDSGKFVPYVPFDEEDRDTEFADYYGAMPDPDEYMFDEEPKDATHYQMYENVSKGTPISPVFATQEELAHWLADHEGSDFAGMAASYEAWLRICKGDRAPTIVIREDGKIVSGVEGCKGEAKDFA